MADVVSSAKQLGNTLLLAAGTTAEAMLTAAQTNTINDLPLLETEAVDTFMEFVPAWGRPIVTGFADSIVNKGTPQLTTTIQKLFGIAMLRIRAITDAPLPAGAVEPAGTIDPRTGHPFGAINPATKLPYTELD